MIHTKIQIRWSDIDQLGHLYNGNYQQYFDLGKTDYFYNYLKLNGNWRETGEWFVAAQTLNNFFSSVVMSEEIEVETTIHSIGNKSFKIYQRMINSVTGELKSDSLSVHVCYNPHTKETHQIPDSLRAKLEKELSKDQGNA